MKKKAIARLLDMANRTIERLQTKENKLRAAQREEFEKALAELRSPVEVRIITPAGRIVAGMMIELTWDVESIDVSSDLGWAEFLPGRRKVEARLSMCPGEKGGLSAEGVSWPHEAGTAQPVIPPA